MPGIMDALSQGSSQSSGIMPPTSDSAAAVAAPSTGTGGQIDPTQNFPNDENQGSDQAMQRLTDDQICKMVKADRDWAYGCFQIYYDKLPDYYKLYRSYSERTVENGRSNIFVPYVFTITENMHARMMSAFFSQRPFVRITPREASPTADETLSAQKSEIYLDSQMDTPCFHRKVDSWFKMAEVLGTAYMKSIWTTEKGIRVQRERIKIPGGGYTWGPARPQDITLWDGPEGHIYAPGQLIIDPSCGPDLQKADFIVEETYKPVSYLQQKGREGIYQNTNNIPFSSAIPIIPALTRMATALKATAQEPPQNRKMVKVWEAWYRNGWVFTIAEETVVLAKRKTPLVHGRYPYVPLHFIPCMDEPFGIGIGEILESLQEELNTGRNQRTDNINFMLNKILKVRKGVYSDVQAAFENKPGKIWEVERMDDAEWMRNPEINSSAFQAEESVKQDAQNAVGVNDYNMGSSNSKLSDTATGITIISEQSASRFKLAIQTFGVSVGELGQQWNALNAQFVPGEMTISVSGNPAVNDGAEAQVTVTPEDLAGNYKFSVLEAISAPDKRANTENKKAIYAEMKTFPWVNMPGLLRWFVRSMGASELEPFIGNPQPPAPPAPDQPKINVSFKGEMLPPNVQGQLLGEPAGAMGPQQPPPGPGPLPPDAGGPPSGPPPGPTPTEPQLQSPEGRALPAIPTVGSMIANG